MQQLIVYIIVGIIEEKPFLPLPSKKHFENRTHVQLAHAGTDRTK